MSAPKPRRASGQGSVRVFRRDDNGTPTLWVAELRWTDGRGRKQRGVEYAKNKRDADRALAELRRRRDAGLPGGAGETTAAYLDRWLRTTVDGHLAPRTVEGYHALVRNHLTPALGTRPLAKLTGADLAELYADRLRSGLHPRTVHHIHACAHKAFAQAVRWRLIDRNPADDADPPTVPPRTVKALSPDQLRAFIAACRGHRLEALFLLVLSTGLREGEAFGLRWQDIDWDAGRARIVQTVGREWGKTVEKDATKNRSSRRTVYLLPDVTDALRRRRDEQRRERDAAGRPWVLSDLVWTTRTGGPLSAQNFLARDYKPLLVAAGLAREGRTPTGRKTIEAPVTFHDLRHSAATYLIARGVPLKIVSALLGHAQIAITADTYGHVDELMLGVAADAMKGLFEDPGHTRGHTAEGETKS